MLKTSRNVQTSFMEWMAPYNKHYTECRILPTKKLSGASSASASNCVKYGEKNDSKFGRGTMRIYYSPLY